MQRAVPEGHGAMAAFMPTSFAQAATIIAETHLQLQLGCSSDGESVPPRTNVLDIANINAPSQLVLSGHLDMVDRAIAIAKKMKLARRAIKLPVSAPFHCELMKPAAKELKERLADAAFNPTLSSAVIANLNAAVIDDGEAFRDLLVEQVTKTVLWSDSIRCRYGRLLPI